MTVPKPAKPRRYESPAGLVVHVNANGSIRRMEHGDIVAQPVPGNGDRGRTGQPLSAPARRPDRVDATARAAQSARAPARRRRAAGDGEWHGLRITLTLCSPR